MISEIENNNHINKNISFDSMEDNKEVDSSHPYEDNPTTEENFDTLSKTENKIREFIANGLPLSEPLLYIDNLPLFRRGNLYSIQGQKGSHKSRIASKIATAIIKGSTTPDSIGLWANPNNDVTVAYINTEMNDLEEFAPIVDKIQRDTGLDVHSKKFRFTSIVETSRLSRFNAILGFIQRIYEESGNHTVVFIDVITDLVSDFNNVSETNSALDFLALLRVYLNCTIVQVIHENPGSMKARGNLGTEIGNKSTGQLRVGFEWKNYQKTGRIFLEIHKIRGSRDLSPIFMEFSEELGDLVCTEDQRKTVNYQELSKQKIDEFIKILPEIMSESRKYSQSELISEIQKKVSISVGTVKSRLNQIIGNRIKLICGNGVSCILVSYQVKGSKTEYSLEIPDVVNNIA
ncbi:AAA family ATPase [Lacihabitans soyangensis]|uniref:AAA family ATPase n=1 Tax=Lacihabitans soyangensis TaxID=869394 RepID=A0AAE3KSC8_9BACT|nr:AAA family ATPase [Lacihabitans soyangensis]MCP9762968.1 hypothetical protein [Lacihabitans soyangensis]